MVVPSVNYYDSTTPPPCVYSEKRIPNKGVPLNLDPDFLCGCDCEDDCLVNFGLLLRNMYIFFEWFNVNTIYRIKQSASAGS